MVVLFVLRLVVVCAWKSVGMLDGFRRDFPGVIFREDFAINSLGLVIDRATG